MQSGNLSESVRRAALDEALDVFAGCLPAGRGREVVTRALALLWGFAPDTVAAYLSAAPAFEWAADHVTLGRVRIALEAPVAPPRGFFWTKQSLRLAQQIYQCAAHEEPMLLVGETGCGKTTLIQQVARLLGKKLVVLNMNDQTQGSDLLGGFKPVDLRQLAVPLYNRCCSLFDGLALEAVSPRRREDVATRRLPPRAEAGAGRGELPAAGGAPGELRGVRDGEGGEGAREQRAGGPRRRARRA